MSPKIIVASLKHELWLQALTHLGSQGSVLCIGLMWRSHTKS